jgi:hypothetical protein
MERVAVGGHKDAGGGCSCSSGEIRSDVMDYHSETNLNFCCLEKNAKEVCPVSY